LSYISRIKGVFSITDEEILIDALTVEVPTVADPSTKVGVPIAKPAAKALAFAKVANGLPQSL
jgi:hypothetical protein